jgi:hypothetical protein
MSLIAVSASAVPWDILISTIGTAAATIIGVLVGGVIGSRAQTRHWSLTAQSEACINLLREHTKIYAELSRANRENPGQRIDASRWAPWNQALAAINLLADLRIVDAAHRVDAEFWKLHLLIARGSVSNDEWIEIRTNVRAVQLDFVNTVRGHLGRREAPLRRISGRPSSSSQQEELTNWLYEQPLDSDLTDADSLRNDEARER